MAYFVAMIFWWIDHTREQHKQQKRIQKCSIGETTMTGMSNTCARTERNDMTDNIANIQGERAGSHKEKDGGLWQSCRTT